MDERDEDVRGALATLLSQWALIPIDGIHVVTQARCVTECMGDL